MNKNEIIEKLQSFSNGEYDIFEDLINVIDEDEDRIYILAEDMSDKGRVAIYNILYNIVSNAFSSLEQDYFRSNFLTFEIELCDSIKRIEKYNKEYNYAGDDDWIYAINTMRLPLYIKEFCKAFERYDIIHWIDDSEICQKSIELYWKLEGIWDYINVRHRQYYGESED